VVGSGPRTIESRWGGLLHWSVPRTGIEHTLIALEWAVGLSGPYTEVHHALI